MSKENVIYLGIMDGETLICDDCKRTINIIAFLYIDESDKIVKETRCEKCYMLRKGN